MFERSSFQDELDLESNTEIYTKRKLNLKFKDRNLITIERHESNESYSSNLISYLIAIKTSLVSLSVLNQIFTIHRCSSKNKIKLN